MMKIAVLPGDGIGEEVMKEALKVLKKVEAKFNLHFDFTHGLIGGAAWPQYKNHFPQETQDLVLDSDAILFGSVGGPVDAQSEPKWKDCEKNSILSIRKLLGLTVNLRPAPIYKELLDFCPLKTEITGTENFEILVIRELSGGIYFGEHSRPTVDTAKDVAEYDRKTIAHIAKFAFESAMKRSKKLTSVDKANVLETSRLWREVFEDTAKEYPEVKLENVLVDNMVQQLVKNPRQFDVIACPNLFGDIVSDLTSVLPGSLGMLGSASFGNKNIHLYEPSGGSAPDIAGKGIANPIAQILSASMMLRHSFHLVDAADAIENAVSEVMKNGLRTGDIYQKKEGLKLVGTVEMGDAICANISL
ncbi:TPA: 3-isopropylmalate dehydrogenase [Candidatus Gracilibacteria bacterium]|nr:3-isopropylmalate dehydrogenase [Candidatus Gracilibacteria bacterium]HIQ57310.1 3-isopropylmalate dehydrogenase [Candidatus Gracilibacteria bacterium]